VAVKKEGNLLGFADELETGIRELRHAADRTAYPLNHPDQKMARFILLKRKDGIVHPIILSTHCLFA